MSFIGFLYLFQALFPWQAVNTLTLDDKQNEYLLSINDLMVLVDSSSIQSFEEITALQQNFQFINDFKPKDYCIECAYWLKVSVRLDEPTDRSWMLEFYDQTIDSISAYFPNDIGAYRVNHVGDYLPFGQKPIQHKNFEWLIDPNLEGEQEFYFRIKSHSYANVRIAIRTVNRFIYYSLNEYFLYGIFYGMIVIISIYNVLMFLAIKERRYLYYAFYIVSVGIYAMCIDGMAYQYLWPNWPQWNQIAYGTALFSLIFWSLVFCKKFLNTRTRAPRLNALLNYVIVARCAIFLYGVTFDQALFQNRNLEIIPLSLIFYTSIYIWTRGYKPARFFVLAYGFLFTGFLVKALLFFSVIPFVFLSYYSLHASFLLEMLFLAFALGDRLSILKETKDRALRRSIQQYRENAKLKDKVNRELEEKIRERTIELEDKNRLLAETNQKLHQQTEEINRINSQLDLDNWKLKSNMKEVLRDRLINKNLTFEQFQDIFPNKLACYQFLEKTKWSSGFVCRKCSNDKYSPGKAKFSRRCTKCGYIESITSHTVFHRIKFPIEKAFYILYVTNNHSEDFTLDQLSEILDLRRNTVWSFKKKIESLSKNNPSKTSNPLLHLFDSQMN